MSQPNIIKLSQTVWELGPAQNFGIRGDKYIIEKVSTLEHDMPTGLYLCLYQILSKYFKPTKQEFGSEIQSREVNKTTTAEVVPLARNTPTGPYLCLYKILSNYFKP